MYTVYTHFRVFSKITQMGLFKKTKSNVQSASTDSNQPEIQLHWSDLKKALL